MLKMCFLESYQKTTYGLADSLIETTLLHKVCITLNYIQQIKITMIRHGNSNGAT